MAHKTLIGGTAYEISGGKTLVNGTAYSIDKGKTLIGGTAYEVGFAPPEVTIAFTISGNVPEQYKTNYAVTIDGQTYGVNNLSTAVVPAGTPVHCSVTPTNVVESRIYVGGSYMLGAVSGGEVVATAPSKSETPATYTFQADKNIKINFIYSWSACHIHITKA